MNAPRHWRTLTLQGNYCFRLCHHSSLRCNCLSKLQWIKELRVLIDIQCTHAGPTATLAELLYLMLSPTFCFSFSAPCKHWCNNAFHYTEDGRQVSLVAPLPLNNRSTAVFKKFITFLAVAKVSRNTPRCNIGGSDQWQISTEARKSCLWWVQHVNDLCVFIGHGAGPALLKDGGTGTALWQRLATADGSKQVRGGLTPPQQEHLSCIFIIQFRLYPEIKIIKSYWLGVIRTFFCWQIFWDNFLQPRVLAWLLNSLFVSTTLPNAAQRNVEMNTRTQILMPFSHPKQITHKDISKYAEKLMKNGCLPWIAFSNCKIFTPVFLECCGPFVLRAGWHSGMNFSAAIWFGLSHWTRGACKSGALLPGCSDLWWKKPPKNGMMQVGESKFEMFLSVWYSWHWEWCHSSAIRLFEHVGWLKAHGC